MAFLPLKEIARSCFKKSYNDNGRRPSITEVLEEGQELIVPSRKRRTWQQGRSAYYLHHSTRLLLVLMPNNPRAGGVSRRIEGDERDELHNVLGSLQVPDGMGLIIRTAVVVAHKKNFNGILKSYCVFGMSFKSSS